jgi:tetratricopeptide (TPR) repeat protein
LGEAWLRHAKPEQALPQLDRAIAIDRSGRMHNTETPPALDARASAYQLRGMALLQLGDSEEARRSFERADQLSPGIPDVLRSLAQLHAMEGDTVSAHAILDRLGLAPADAARGLMENVAALDRRGARRAMESSLRGAVALDPRAEAGWVGLVRLFAIEGRPDSALAVLERANAIGLDAGVYAAHRVLIAAVAGRRQEEQEWRARIPEDARSDPRVRGTLELAAASPH